MVNVEQRGVFLGNCLQEKLNHPEIEQDNDAAALCMFTLDLIRFGSHMFRQNSLFNVCYFIEFLIQFLYTFTNIHIVQLMADFFKATD